MAQGLHDKHTPLGMRAERVKLHKARLIDMEDAVAGVRGLLNNAAPIRGVVRRHQRGPEQHRIPWWAPSGRSRDARHSGPQRTTPRARHPPATITSIPVARSCVTNEVGAAASVTMVFTGSKLQSLATDARLNLV